MPDMARFHGGVFTSPKTIAWPAHLAWPPPERVLVVVEPGLVRIASVSVDFDGTNILAEMARHLDHRKEK